MPRTPRFLLLLAAMLLVESVPTLAQKLKTAALPTVQQGEPPYRREFTYGVTSNTNSGLIGGGSVRSTYFRQLDWYWFWQVELTEVKNPKELRIPSNITGDYFIRGKTNYLYALRPAVGIERVIFHKAAEQGVQVSALASAGPSIGLEVPYYVLYDYDPAPQLQPVDVRREQHAPERLSPKYDENRVLSGASFLTGLGELKPIAGAHLRGALAFEYGRYREGVTGLEAGFTVEAYARRPVLLPQADRNPQVWTAVYLTLFLGRRS